MNHNVYRVGRTIGRTIYLQLDDEPDDNDVCLGMVDDAGFAAHVVRLLNSTTAEQYDHDDVIIGVR